MARKKDVSSIKRGKETFYFYGGTESLSILKRDGKKAHKKGFKYRIEKDRGNFRILYINNPKLKNSKNPKKTMNW